MSDWEIVENKPQLSSGASSDWEEYDSPEYSKKQRAQESLGAAAFKSPFRAGEDVIRGAWHLLKNVPEYFEAAKTEVPGLFRTLKEHPGHALKQGIAGLGEAGAGLLNAPHDIAEYGANRLNLLPESFPEKIPYFKNATQGINSKLGAPEYPGESLIRGAGRNALNALGAGKLVSTFNPMKLTVKNIAKDIVDTKKENKDLYSKLYKNLWEESEKKGSHDLSNSLRVKATDMRAIHKYSPQKSIEGLTDYIRNPNVETAHKAKSDLLKVKRNLEKKASLNTSESKHLSAANNIINNIENSMFKNKEGILNNALLDKYRKIQKGYATEVVPYHNKAISKHGRNEISDKELVNALSHGEFRQKRGEFHPAIGLREKFPTLAKSGGIAGGGAIAKMIYDNMMGPQSNE